MAFRATNYWRSVLTRAGSRNRSFATAASAPVSHTTKLAIDGEWTPIAVVGGLVLVAMGIAAHTAKQQLAHSPAVNISKRRRETVPEVEEPEHVINSANKFLNKSFLRKVAHIQEFPRAIQDPVRADPYTRPRDATTLKAVGVDPARK